jgi:hypothetical protein
MRETYEMGDIGSSSSPEGERAIWKKFWKAAVPSKMLVFAWKVIKNGLPTRANRNYRHLDPESMCALCGMQKEDVFHAVITCPHAYALRSELRKRMALPGPG